MDQPQDSDLAKQYQDILDQYSKELASKPTTNSNSDTVSEPEISANIPLTEIPPPPPPTSLPSPAPNLPPPPTPTYIPPVSTPIVSQPHPNNFFKILFYLSLLIFLGVCTAIVYALFINNPAKKSSSSADTTSPTPTISTQSCQLNNQTFAVDQSFWAADGCNTCTCLSDLTISCTNKICPATSSSQMSSDTGPLKTILTTINKNLNTSYQETYEANGSVLKSGWKVDLTKSSDKSNILIIKKSITDFGLVIQPEEGGEAGDGWKEVYARNADVCELEMQKSVLTLSCHN